MIKDYDLNCQFHRNKINDLIRSSEFTKAKKILEKLYLKIKNDHWIQMTLANVYYELKHYKTALKLSYEAIDLEPNCYETNYSHDIYLFVNNDIDQAIEIWNKLLSGQIVESCNIKNIKSILNNTRAWLGKAYIAKKEFDKAVIILNDHLSNRKRRMISDFIKKEINKLIQKIIC